MEISASPGRYTIQYDEANNRWYFQQIDSASVQHNVTINRAMADETITLIMAWTAAIVAGSINGSAFSSTAAGTSAVFSSDLYIGDSVWGGQQANLDFFWFACGTGTLTDADAAAIHANGNPDPPKALFPTAAAVKLIWNAITDQARQYA